MADGTFSHFDPTPSSGVERPHISVSKSGSRVEHPHIVVFKIKLSCGASSCFVAKASSRMESPRIVVLKSGFRIAWSVLKFRLQNLALVWSILAYRLKNSSSHMERPGIRDTQLLVSKPL